VGKTFWVGEFESLLTPQVYRDIYFFNPESSNFSTAFNTDEISQAYHYLDRTLQKHGFLLQFKTFAELPGLLKKWQDTHSRPAGLIFYSLHTGTYSQLKPVLFPFLSDSRIKELGVPVLIDWRAGVLEPTPAGISVLHRGNILTAMARQLAHFLVNKGYGNILFFEEDEHKYMWQYHYYLRIRREIHRLNPRIACRAIIKPAGSGKRKDFLDRYQKKVLASNITTYGQFKGPALKALFDEFITTRSGFSKALSLGKNTIWLFPFTARAGAALTWLEKNSIKVPDDISVLALENYPTYYHRGLSYCDLDHDRIGYLMAHSLIRDFPVEKSTRGYIRTRPRVVEKLTTK